MKDPVDHIDRPSLPWRKVDDQAITECGFDASKVKSLSREEFFKRLKEYGKQRTSLLTCMTCMSTSQRWPTWEEDPRKALEREIAWEATWRGQHGHLLKEELIAIEALIARHRDEFETLLKRQEWLARKASRGDSG